MITEKILDKFVGELTLEEKNKLEKQKNIIMEEQSKWNSLDSISNTLKLLQKEEII